MNARPTPKQWLTMVIICICTVTIGLAALHSSRNLTASTQGMLDDHYTEVTRTDHSVQTKSYECTYTFAVGGSSYQGKGTLYTEPDSPSQTVYYDPHNPAINALTEHPSNDSMFAVAGVFAVLGLIAYLMLPIYAYGAVPPGVVAGAGKGDAAGEYLNMSNGKYAAGHYVGIGFGALLAGSTYLGYTGLSAVLGSHISGDLLIIVVALACSALTLAMFWDRWKCNTIFCSNYCSGCGNLSIIYMPFVAALYGLYRGVMKLTRQ